MRSITWDVALIAIAVILLAYTFLIKRHKSLTALIAVYISYIVTVNWGNVVVGLFTGDRLIFKQMWIKANAAPHLVQIGLFIILALLIFFFTKFIGKRSRYSFLEVALYSVSAVSLGAIFVVAFLPIDIRTQALASSKILPYLYNWREWLVLAPVLIMIAFGIYSSEED